MPVIFALATRNLLRARWRTALAGVALALTTALLVVTLALIEGLFDGMVRGVTRRGDGDALLVPRPAPGGGRRHVIPDAAAVAGILRGLPTVAGAAPRLRIDGVLRVRGKQAAAQVVGVDPVAEAAVTDVLRLLIGGAGLTTDDEAMLGEALARQLGARPGDELTLFARAADGFPAVERFRVAGVFATGDQGRDATLALVGIDPARALAGLTGAAHEIALSFAPGVDPRAAAAAVAAALPPGSDLVLVPWQKRLPALAEAVRFSRASSWWLIGLFHAAAGIVTLIVLLLGMHERRREHALCLALGVPPGLLRRVIAAEALLLGAGAVAAGALVGSLVAWPLATRGIALERVFGPIGYAGGTILPVLHAAPRCPDLLRAAAAMLAVCALAGWMSGRGIERLTPASVLAGRDAP